MGLLSRLLGTEGAARDLLADLSEDYRAEAAQAALLRAHAERARYPQAASALRDLADIEDRHAEWLRTRLLASAASRRRPGRRRPAATTSGSARWPRCTPRRRSAAA